MINARLILLLGSISLITAGCTVPKQEEAPVEPVEPVQEVQPNPEILKALAQLDELKQELKQLRNSVEELQFETENAKRRQQDLFRDIDRRMVDLERNQNALSPQIEGANTQIDPQTGAVVLVGEASDTAVEPNSTGAATEVTVVASDSTSGSDSTSSATLVPGNSSSEQAAALSASVSLEQQNAYEAAFDLLKQSRYEDSIQSFRLLVDTWPTSQLADDAYYWMSEARYVNREFEYALSGFRTVVSRYPDSQRVPEALLKIGYIQYDIGAYDDAAETFRDILARFPGHQVTVSAQTRLRRIEQTIQ